MRYHARRTLGSLAVLVLAAACTTSEASSVSGATQDSIAPGSVIDSIIPIEEQLRRFREDLPEVSALSKASPSRDALVQRFVRAIESNDSTAVRDMVLDRAEFAYLYYPHTQYTSKPYELDPGLLWFMTTQNSEKGIKRLLRRFGGRSIGYESYACENEPKLEDDNSLWQQCRMVARAIAADGSELRLFGTIIERDGQFKFISYTNEF